MKSVRVQAALLPILFLLGQAANAEQIAPTTLKSLDEKAILTGTLKAADTETFTLETVVGVYMIRRAAVTCTGFCPVEDASFEDAVKVAQSG